ncbi:MAG: hypothetical protein ABSG68_06655 [Thermoguttaceae bacterium]
MLPAIITHAKIAFGGLKPEARQDAIQETVANALVAFVALFRRGKVSLAYPTVLAKYAVAQIRDGRRVGNHLNVREVLSRYAQKHKGFNVERLDRFNEEEDAWLEAVVEDKNAGPAEIARVRVDFSDWLASLKRRDRRIAEPARSALWCRWSSRGGPVGSVGIASTNDHDLMIRRPSRLTALVP